MLEQPCRNLSCQITSRPLKMKTVRHISMLFFLKLSLHIQLEQVFMPYLSYIFKDYWGKVGSKEAAEVVCVMRRSLAEQRPGVKPGRCLWKLPESMSKRMQHWWCCDGSLFQPTWLRWHLWGCLQTISRNPLITAIGPYGRFWSSRHLMNSQ